MWQTLPEILFAKIRSEKRPSILLLTIVTLPKEVLISLICNSKHLCSIKLNIVCFPLTNSIVLRGTCKLLTFSKNTDRVFSFAPEDKRMFPLLVEKKPILHTFLLMQFLDTHVKFYTAINKMHIERSEGFKEWKTRLRVSNPLFHCFLLINKNQ